MSERFKPGDMIKHKQTGEVLTFKEYGTDPWEGWAVVTHRHGSTLAPTWWNLEDCTLDVTGKALVEFTETTIRQGKEIEELKALCIEAAETIDGLRNEKLRCDNCGKWFNESEVSCTDSEEDYCISCQSEVLFTERSDWGLGNYPHSKLLVFKLTSAVNSLEAAGEENSAAAVTASQPDEELFYIQDTRAYVGNDLLFWGKDSNGYTCHINQAGLYTKEEAIRKNQRRHTDVPWPKGYIDARIGTSVDAQHVSIEEALAGTGIVLNEAPKQVNKPDQCWKCGKFVSKDRPTPECPHCDTDLSS